MENIYAIGIIGAVGILYFTSVRDEAQNAFADCIYHEARSTEYSGDIYSNEARNTFAPLCVKK